MGKEGRDAAKSVATEIQRGEALLRELDALEAQAVTAGVIPATELLAGRANRQQARQAWAEMRETLEEASGYGTKVAQALAETEVEYREENDKVEAGISALQARLQARCPQVIN